MIGISISIGQITVFLLLQECLYHYTQANATLSPWQDVDLLSKLVKHSFSLFTRILLEHYKTCTFRLFTSIDTLHPVAVAAKTNFG
jgi:hypothetical protein